MTDQAGRPGRARPPTGGNARRVALDVLDRIDAGGAFANIVLGHALAGSGLSERDRRFVTHLVYGTTRMRRACDFLVDRYLTRSPRPRVRNALRLGAYQLAFADVAPHAAVAETVAVVPRSARGLVNAVLRKVARSVSNAVEWPDDATRLSVPDWVLGRLTQDLGTEQALAALEAMNLPAEVTTRDDGYVQDAASQQVAAAVPAEPGDRVLDVCAAPGGKTTALAAAGAFVVAGDLHTGRLGLVRDNAGRLGVDDAALALVAADGAAPPWRNDAFDHVLVDAPCSGLGTLRRRPDLRWRVEEEAVKRLAELQQRMLLATARKVRPGGTLTYSVCTLTSAESLEVDSVIASEHNDLVPLSRPPSPWETWGRGAILLPQSASTDGMCLFRYRRAA